MSKYETLVNVLDELRKDAPSNYKKYYPPDTDIVLLNQARSRAYIHLFLKVKFGLLDFLEREKYITDDPHDGGIDAYYIDDENKKIYFIQSKFRVNEKNFEQKNISISDIYAMDLDRITKGEVQSSKSVTYNSKVQNLIKLIQSIADYAKYEEIVIILANLKDKYDSAKLKSLTVFPYQVYNYERCYEQLLFPVVSGTYFNPKELRISIDVTNSGGSNRIDYYVDTKVKECNITALFVPTREIGRILFKYKNSILKFNPRSFLELATGSVNQNIKESITEIKTNDFALFNNGITMLSDNTYYKDRVGKRGEACLIVTNPQIINGGQTAFTLSRIYEEIHNNKISSDIFKGKEVLLKVITFDSEELESSQAKEKNKLKLIEAISRATNNQTAVTEADRRSNDEVQVQLQRNIFSDFGYFYERKKGEFGDGLRNRYMDRIKLIDREIFLRTVLSVDGNPAQSRRGSAKQIFKIDAFNNILKTPQLYSKYFFSYLSYVYLNNVQKKYDKDKNNRYGVAQFGNAIRYGKWAVVNVVSRFIKSNMQVEEIENTSQSIINKWDKFEETVKKLPLNKAYFKERIDQETGERTLEINFDNYYKGRTLISDLDSYNWS